MLAWRKSLGKYGLVKSDCEIPMIKDDEVLVKVLASIKDTGRSKKV